MEFTLQKSESRPGTDLWHLIDGNTTAAALMLHPKHGYFGGSLHIQELRLAGQYPLYPVMGQLLQLALKQYAQLPDKCYITADLKRTDGLMRKFYCRLGFRQSIAVSALGPDYCVMVASLGDLRSAEKC